MAGRIALGGGITMAYDRCLNWCGVKKQLTYLAVPYSHPDRAVRLARFEAVNRAAADLMRQGHYVYSPISHTHPIAEAGGLPLGWEYWQQYDRAIMAACNQMVVLMLDGWCESVGVTAEIALAEELGIAVAYLAPSEVAA